MARGTQTLLEQYWRAQARIGARVSVRALEHWDAVNPLSLAETGSAWLGRMLQLIRGSRSDSRRLAAAFYRTHRALETGTTLSPLDVPPHDGITTIGELWDDWAQLVDVPDPVPADSTDVVQVDGFDWPEEPVSDFDSAAATSLTYAGPVRLQNLIADERERQERGRLDDPDFLSRLSDEFASAGRNTAQVADRESLRSGRDLIDRVSDQDRTAIGWARVTDGNPCGFCAMLAARGAVYRTRASAETARSNVPPVNPEDLRRYHYGCHCQMVPIYSRNDFHTAESRRLAQEWRDVTRGLVGDDARRAWRRHIESQTRRR